MAKNREPVSEPQPEREESVGTEEEESSEEEEEEGSEDERPLPKTRSQISTPQKHPPPPSSSEDEDEEEEEEEEDAESDSDSDSRIRKPDPNIKPIASKPMTDDPPKSSAAASSARKPRSKPGPSGPTSPTKPGAKRPAEKESEAKETKKTKKKPDAAADGESSEKRGPSSVVNDDAKKQLFQRLWSEEDEIVILKGMTEYAAKKKADPVADIGAFLEFIKKSLHIDVTKTQLQDKIRRLKKKFENNASKEKNGKERTFSKPHEQAAYELSKKIWASVHDNNGNVGGEKVAETPKVSGSVVRKSRSKTAVALTPKFNEVEDKEMKDVEEEDNGEGLKKVSVGGGLGYLSVAEWIVNDGAKMVEGEKREEMEEKWRKIKEEEVELFLKRAELMCEQTRLVLETIRKTD